MPFIFGVAINARHVSFGKITMNGRYHEFSRFALDGIAQRVQCIAVVLKMACVSKHFITENYVVAADVPFNTVVHRIGKDINITMRCVEVTYTVDDGVRYSII